MPEEAPKKSYLLYAVFGIIALVVLYIVVLVYQATQTSDDLLSSISSDYTSEFSSDQTALGTTVSTSSVESDDDPTLGSPNARVRIVEFGDFQCPFCNRAVEILKAVENRYGDQVLIQYRDFPIVTSHPESYAAAQAAQCAFEQGQDAFWEYHDRLFQFQDELSRDVYLSLAQRNGLDVAAFETCLNESRYADEVEADYLDGLDAGVTGTPTFFINGRKVPGVIPEDVLFRVIDQLLKENA